jgi:NAD(P) transhydrogenase
LATGADTEVKCDAYLAAVGRKPNTANLNLASAGIEIDEYGGILVDSNLRATAKAGNVYAAGDVLGRPFLASTGVAQGVAAIAAIFGEPGTDPASVSRCGEDDLLCIDGDISMAGDSFDPGSLATNPFAFPIGVWSSPEASYYGLSVQQAKEMGLDANEAIALYAECLRGRVFSPNGLLKLVFEKPTGRILGVHIVGEDACELIHYGMELVKARRTIVDLTNSLYSAVTFHEMYKIAAQAALDEPGARKRRAAAGKALAARNRESRATEVGN